MNRKPPPVLDCHRVIAYAIRTPSIRYSGRSYLFVEGKEIGPVPRLVICRDDNRGMFMLIHCDHGWNALGLSTDFRTLTKAKARAERIYPGLMGAWKKTGVTRIQAKRYLDRQGQRCGSCNKAWYEVEAMVELCPRRGKATLALCGYCIDDLYRQLHE